MKSLIFIPIISQTYCDPKSYAWTKEFLAFKDFVKEDQFGLKIKLANGNVANRILPVKINDLDEDDRKLLEEELGPLRSIDFIFKSPGVNRPLRSHEEEPKANLNHTIYRDQINKVAYAIKELISSLKNGPTTGKGESDLRKPVSIPNNISPHKRKRVALISGVSLLLAIAFWLFYFLGAQSTTEPSERRKYIAVLPFTNMNRDSAQDYFSEGITEDIRNQLVKISDLNVKSGISTFQYRNTSKSIPEIASELDVETIVGGSVRRNGNEVRIAVQLIDVKNDIHLWSETYDREISNALSLQSEVAMQIATALNAKLSNEEKENLKVESINATAYEYYLMARKIYKTYTPEKRDLDHALKLLEKAISIDPEFAAGYAAIGDILYFYMPVYGINETISIDSTFALAEKAIQLDPTCADAYLLRGYILLWNYTSHEEGRKNLERAYRLAPNNSDVLRRLGWLYQSSYPKNEGSKMILKALHLEHTIKEASYFLKLGEFYVTAGDYANTEKLYLYAQTLDPGNPEVYSHLSLFYRVIGKFEDAIKASLQYWKYFPNESRSIDDLAWSYFESGNLDKAEEFWSKYKEVERAFEDTTQRTNFRHRLALIKWMKGNKDEALRLFNEQLKIDEAIQNKQRRSPGWASQHYLYNLAAVNSFLGNKEIALKNLDSLTGIAYFPYLLAERDPLMDNIRNEKGYKDWAARKRLERSKRSKAMFEALNEYEASDQIKKILGQ